MKLQDKTGQRFEMLTVTRRAENDKHGHVRWECLCDCGKTCYPSSNNLKRGNSTSCGCRIGIVGREMKNPAKPNPNYRRHWAASKGRPVPEYQIWLSMKQRCCNPKDVAYHSYGGRGITVCKEWLNDFPTFMSQIGHRPSKWHSLDRVDNDGNYEPSNVRWATKKEQQNNRRTVKDLQAKLLEYERRFGKL